MGRPRDDRRRPSSRPASAGPRPPAARGETVRESIARALRGGPLTLQELSGVVRVSEKQLIEHLEHLAQSLGRQQERLEIEPARCLACGFSFATRTRLAKPSRCPQCKSNRISHPRFFIAPR